MEPKVFTLQNKGMNRDLSISKAGESSAYENHNIRIEARDNDTLLSVTNERGNKEISLGTLSIQGTLIGWNVLNRHIILFTHDEDNTDRIYRVDYNPGEEQEFEGVLLVEDNFNFSVENPVESVVYFESEEIQKIYWVDGRNVLRFMNFMAGADERSNWDSTYFDSNRAVEFGVTVSIEKENSGNTRSNGTVQYILTYFNNHGQESGYVWCSDLVYLAPPGRGGAADETNNNSIILTFSNLDTRFSHFRVYSLTRTSLNGTRVAAIIYEGETSSSSVIVVDDAANYIAVDADTLLYLGSREVHPNTITHKDQHLFLGDLQSIGREDISAIKEAVKDSMFVKNNGENTPEANSVTFAYDTGGIDFPDAPDSYSFDNQLKYTSSQITTFKGGEKYRFGIVLHLKDGSSTDAIWIGDKVNSLYPKIENGKIKRVIAKCTLPQEVEAAIRASDQYRTVQLVIAEAAYADRSVKAQGIVNPTMFNVWDRYTNGLYAMSSWISRPRGSDYAWKHFEPVKNSTTSYGEIECNYWTTSETVTVGGQETVVDVPPTPYYRRDTTKPGNPIADKFDGTDDFTHVLQIFMIKSRSGASWDMMSYIIKAAVATDANVNDIVIDPSELSLSPDTPVAPTESGGWSYSKILSVEGYTGISALKAYVWFGSYDDRIGTQAGPETTGYRLFTTMQSWLVNEAQPGEIIEWDTIWSWMQECMTSGNNKKWQAFNKEGDDTQQPYNPPENVFSYTDNTWEELMPAYSDNPAAYYRKHIMFVDENVLTLNSPELEYEAVNLDNVENYKFRIVGVAKVTDTLSDYAVSARHGKLAGENLVYCNFKESKKSGNRNGLISWPLWRENGLIARTARDGEGANSYVPVEPIQDRTSYDYLWSSTIVTYWLHMWNRIGRIGYYTDTDESDYGDLNSKVFSNLRYCYETRYNNLGSGQVNYNVGVRVFNQVASQYLGIDIKGERKYYDGVVSTSLMPPGSHKYPVLYSNGNPSTDEMLKSENAYLYTNQPIQLDYFSTPHAVISLPTVGNNQTILPRYSGISSEVSHINDTPPAGRTSPFVPWDAEENAYSVTQQEFSLASGSSFISEGDKYFYIGEIYKDYGDYSATDTRYGGSTEAAIASNRFIPAGKQYDIDNITAATELLATEGDTFFQRWDCLKTRPIEGNKNGVADIMSVMLETHINIDGRTDKQRGVRHIASLDWTNYGSLNFAYTQPDNYYTRRVLGDDANLDTYRSTITWSKEKHDSSQIDEWSHVTLASTLALDGDKGPCQSLKRFQNSLIAFQDRGIAEILFNSRTQVSTTDGVPIEIANSGKVDGKRYITNKYGCLNKWSIIEGKSALYFVDNINKVFCGFGGEGIQPISSRQGFDAWFRQANTIKSWTPEPFNNIVSFYDRIHSDIYLVRNSGDDMPCLVYNELLGTFTSFFDYRKVPMMANVEDRFVSFKDGTLWLQNEGFYGSLFGTQYDYWTRYRVTPDPYGDKIWTNIEFRADWYQVLGNDMNAVVPEEYLINGDSYGALQDTYKENETFSTLRIWNEYQTTGDIAFSRDDNYVDPVRKKFRIWRLTIPRALKEGTNRHGLDRIRNPWIDLVFRKAYTSEEQKKQLMQLHDIVVKYFE